MPIIQPACPWEFPQTQGALYIVFRPRLDCQFESHPFPGGTSCLQWCLPPHSVLTKILIDLPRLETLFLDGAIATSVWLSSINLGLPLPLLAVLPSIKKLEVRLLPIVPSGTVYWPLAPTRYCQLQYLRLERCRVCWWLKSLVLTPPIPPLVQLYCKCSLLSLPLIAKFSKVQSNPIVFRTEYY